MTKRVTFVFNDLLKNIKSDFHIYIQLEMVSLLTVKARPLF